MDGACRTLPDGATGGGSILRATVTRATVDEVQTGANESAVRNLRCPTRHRSGSISSMPLTLALHLSLTLASPFSTGSFEIAEPPAGGTGGDPTATTTDAPAMPPDESVLDPNDPYATTDGTGTEGPATGPAPMNPAAGTQPPPKPKPPSKTGVGLMVGAGAAGAVGWGANIARIVRFERGCRETFELDENSTEEDFIADPIDCFSTLVGNIGFTALHWAGNWTAIGLAAGAGNLRGKHNAYGQAMFGKPKHKALNFQVAGGVVLGLGVVSAVLSRGLTLGIIGSGAECTDFDCLNRVYAGRILWVQAGSSAIATGAGLLAYGLALDKRLNYYERVLQMQPTVAITPHFTGAGVQGRF